MIVSDYILKSEIEQLERDIKKNTNVSFEYRSLYAEEYKGKLSILMMLELISHDEYRRLSSMNTKMHYDGCLE